LSYSPVFKNIAEQLGKLKLKVHAQPLQHGAQAEVSQVGNYHVFHRPACPRGQEESDPTKSKRAQEHRKGIEERAQHSGDEEDGLRAVTVNHISETKIKTAVAIADEAPACVPGEISADGTDSFADSGYRPDYGRIQHASQCERENNAEARQNEGPVGEYTDNKAADVTPAPNLVEVLSMQYDKDRQGYGNGYRYTAYQSFTPGRSSHQ